MTATRRLALVLLAAGAAVRVALLLAPDVWHDEATNGLMALTVLRGELPLYFYGQPFMGALDAYLAAPFHYLFGPSILTLKLLPLALTLTWLALTVRLAWEAFGPRAAVFAAALLAVPADFLLSWAIETRTKYHLGLTLGTLALLLALRPLGRDLRRDLLRFGVLGLILGLAFWTNFLSAVFFLPVAILLLRQGLVPALRGLPAAAVTFGLGSLPHWIYGLAHGTAVPGGGGWIGWAALARHLEAVGRVAWPIVTGVPESARDETTGIALSVALAAVFGLTVAVAVRAAWRPGGGRAAMLALLALVATNVGVAVGTHHGDRIDNDPKYFLPLYTALPTLAGAGLAALPRVAWAPLLAGLLAVQGAGASGGELQKLSRDGRASLAADRQIYQETMAAIRRDGPDRFYSESPNPSILMYLSNERIVVSDPYQESYPPYARAVDGAPHVGWWFGGRHGTFEAHLAALGVQFAFRPLGPRGGAYVDFALPAERLRELDPGTLRVTASPDPEAASHVLDRDARTFWSTDRPKQGGEWIQVDLGRIEPVALVRWLPRVFQEIPSGLRLDASLDGVTWRRLVELPEYNGPFYWSAGRPMLRVRSGRVELRVPPTPTRHLRITQTGTEIRWPWSVEELFVYVADPTAPPTPPDAEGAPLTRAIQAAGVRRLYADHGWAYRLALADPAVRVPPANLPLDAYNFRGPESELFPVVRWEPGSGALVEPPDVPGFVRTAEASGLGVQRTDLGGLSLFTYEPPPPPPGRPISPAELRVTASVATERAARIADGNRHPGWTTGRGQAPGDWLRVDLAAPRRVRGVRLSTTAPDEWPRALRLEGTVDGATWTTLAASVRTENRVRWAGVTWLRENTSAVWLEVPPVMTRALRLVLTRGDADHAWSVHDVTVYAAE